MVKLDPVRAAQQNRPGNHHLCRDGSVVLEDWSWAAVLARGSTLMQVPGVTPAGAARILADVGDIARFADRTGSRPGPAPPLEASSGEQL